MKYRNISGYPLELRQYGRVVGPGGEIDMTDLGYDPDKHGVITGFEPVEESKQPAKPKAAAAKTSDKDKEQK